ncbi:hypothetical protein LTR56_023797 [Elasticomyces elasticus]|nr:hypothetical protein LTR56_023797 [Elasticomyces elasticus]KAK4906501.1 hypothetical protein LTR49_024346 [Elasticomyces elasticus]KAK5745405.1 hypothetical protein LTS12_023124 [Elasticomyces elasticus]
MAEDGESPRKVWRLASSKPNLGCIVTISVGKGSEVREFSVHEELLCRHSDFFKAALNGSRWREGLEGKVSLPEEEPEFFEGFQAFLYSGFIFTNDPAQKEEADDSGCYNDNEYETMGKAWLLADRIQSCSYKDALTDSIALKIVTEAAYPTGMQNLLREGTSMSAGFPRLLLDVAICAWDVESFGELDLDSIPQAFVMKLIKGLAESADREDKDRPWVKEDCHYHDHGEEKPCYKIMFTY